MKKATAFAPGHITGFFAIQDQDVDPLKKGSTGAGFCLARGVTTTVEESRETKILLGEEAAEAPVSRTVLEVFSRRTGITLPPLTVRHAIDIPLGAGFGSSGAGALSLSLALRNYFNSPLTWEEAAQVAHEAEILCRSGLGTVMGEAYGRFEIRLAPGAPGIGRVVMFPAPRDWEAVFCVYGALSTKGYLSDPVIRERIIQQGKDLTVRLVQEPTMDHFLELSRQFALGTGLLSPRLQEALGWAEAQTAKGHSVRGSMLMFGEGLFFLLPPGQGAAFGEALSARCPGARIFHSALDLQGAR